ncbi:hypothetical protein C8Q75DRAFT_785156 [Abortiporus biennis]|nr:hypothetical protein C8Q75DRAFT_785156 [Abortiporus biennis]
MGRNKSHKPEVPLRTKLKKDPGIPRLPNLKLRNAEKQRLQHHSVPHRPDPDSTMASEPTLSSLAELASTSAVTLENAEANSNPKFQTKEQLRRHYVRALHRVIDESDIILLVLDARDPEGCRSRLVEEEVRRREGEGKRLIFILNKIDLVPSSNAQAWLRYLRHSTPTLPFRSVSSSSSVSSATSPALLRLIKAYRASGKQSITVGVVGYPNVGKSSLVNALKRVKVCPVAAQPGHTTSLQTVHLERGIKIVDSPGVIFEDDNMDDAKRVGGARGSLKLRNVMKVEDVEDPIEVVEEILARVDPATIQKLYNIPPSTGNETGFGSTLEFLTMLSLMSGRLLKGGTPDILGTARQILNDWNHQKIPYYTTPPTIHPSSIPSSAPGGIIAPGAENVGQARIITEFGKAFEVEGLFGMADQGAFGSKQGEANDMVMEEDPGVGKDVFMEDSGSQMVEDTSIHSLKRRHSPEPEEEPVPSVNPNDASGSSAPREEPGYAHRAPKRMRKANAADPLSNATISSMAHNNPLNRKAVKRDMKKARRAARLRHHAHGDGGMEVDDIGLNGTIFPGGHAGEVDGPTITEIN